MLLDILSSILIFLGCAFFASGMLGLHRLPDFFCQLHAVTKVDNLGLGLIIFGCVIQTQSWSEGIRLVLIWLLVLLASAAACSILAQAALERTKPSKKEESLHE